jgi:hypothetical protein
MTANAGVIVVNNSFETPVQASGGFTYNPTGAGWTFVDDSGIAGANSGLFTTPAPNGTQAAFVQANGDSGSFSESITGLTVGTAYTVSFFESAMPNMAIGADPVTVSLGATSLGTFTNASAAWLQETTGSVVATATAMTLTFASEVAPQNLLSNIDEVTVQTATVTTTPEPATVFLFASALGALLFWYRKSPSRKSAV